MRRARAARVGHRNASVRNFREKYRKCSCHSDCRSQRRIMCLAGVLTAAADTVGGTGVGVAGAWFWVDRDRSGVGFSG